MAPKVAVPMPPIVKPPIESEKSPAPENQRHSGDDQIAVLAEVDVVLNPDAGAGHGDETEHNNRHTGKNRLRNRLNQSAELRREAEQDRERGSHREEQRGVDAGSGHHADILTVRRDARAAHGGGNDSSRDRRP